MRFNKPKHHFVINLIMLLYEMVYPSIHLDYRNTQFYKESKCNVAYRHLENYIGIQL